MGNNEKKDKKNYIIFGGCIIIVILLIVIAFLVKTNNIDNKNIDTDIIIKNNMNNNDDVNINKKENKKIKAINLNETAIKEGKYELTVNEFKFAKKILPPNVSSYYTYYEAKEDGHQYLEVKYNYKNLNSTEVEADKIVSMKMKYDNKYEYTGFSVIEDSSSDFTYANITNIAPLTTGKLHYLFDVPDEVAKSDKSIVVIVNCGNEEYEIKIR